MTVEYNFLKRELPADFIAEIQTSSNFETQFFQKVYDSFNSQFERLVTDCLESRGYSFSTKQELIEFVSINCKCHDYPHNQEKIYFVNDTPFLKWNYKAQYDYSPNKASAVFGTYEIL